MIQTLLLGIVGGFVTHRSNDVFDALPGVFSGGWREMTGHILGVLAAYPFVELVARALEIPRNLMPRLRAAYLTGFVFFGLGVGLGWLYDTVQRRERK